MEVAQDRQKKYADHDRKGMDFEPGEAVLLKVSPWKGVTRFGKSGKLKPRYVGPFEILRRDRKVAYELALPPQLQHIHNVFHISMLKKYKPDSSHMIEYEPLDIQPNLSYIEQPVQILDRQEKVLINKSIALVKVLEIREWKIRVGNLRAKCSKRILSYLVLRRDSEDRILLSGEGYNDSIFVIHKCENISMY